MQQAQRTTQETVRHPEVDGDKTDQTLEEEMVTDRNPETPGARTAEADIQAEAVIGDRILATDATDVQRQEAETTGKRK